MQLLWDLSAIVPGTNYASNTYRFIFYWHYGFTHSELFKKLPARNVTLFQMVYSLEH